VRARALPSPLAVRLRARAAAASSVCAEPRRCRPGPVVVAHTCSLPRLSFASVARALRVRIPHAQQMMIIIKGLS